MLILVTAHYQIAYYVYSNTTLGPSVLDSELSNSQTPKSFRILWSLARVWDKTTGSSLPLDIPLHQENFFTPLYSRVTR